MCSVGILMMAMEMLINFGRAPTETYIVSRNFDNKLSSCSRTEENKGEL